MRDVRGKVGGGGKRDRQGGEKIGASHSQQHPLKRMAFSDDPSQQRLRVRPAGEIGGGGGGGRMKEDEEGGGERVVAKKRSEKSPGAGGGGRRKDAFDEFAA